MIKISFTYSKVTPESAEQGDMSDRGHYDPGGWFWSDFCDEVRDDFRANPNLYNVPWKPGDLKSAIETAKALGICEFSCSPFDADHGGWWSSIDADQDYTTGEDTYYSLHIEGITSATRARIHRELTS